MAKARMGRPPKAPTPGERIGMSLRVTPDMKNRLDQAAQDNGRSLSQEAEVRLEQSFRDDDLLPQLMAAAYGERLAGVLMMVGAAMSLAGRGTGTLTTLNAEGAANWMDHPWAFEQSRAAIDRVLDTVRPEGEASPPPAVTAMAAGSTGDAGLDAALKTAASGMGVGIANSVISAAHGDAVTGELRRWAQPVRKMLGTELVKRISKRSSGAGAKGRAK
jgi:TraY domain-containing protein